MTPDLWLRFILALGALVVVPLGLQVVNRRAYAALALPAALLLTLAQLLSSGPIAAALVLARRHRPNRCGGSDALLQRPSWTVCHSRPAGLELAS